MRERKEIEEVDQTIRQRTREQNEILVASHLSILLETLLDIRELLTPAPAVGYPGITGKVFDPGEEKVGEECKHELINGTQVCRKCPYGALID